VNASHALGIGNLVVAPTGTTATSAICAAITNSVTAGGLDWPL